MPLITLDNVDGIVVNAAGQAVAIQLSNGQQTPIGSGQILGTATNDNAVAGNVGELITGILASGNAVTLTTATAANVVSMSLTPGDWEIEGVADFLPAASTSISVMQQGASTTSATFAGQDTFTTEVNGSGGIVPGAVTISSVIPTQRLSIAATTTVYLVAQATFTVAGMTVYGSIRARRVR
jgi:hypothetical protein